MNSLYANLKGKNGKKITNHLSINLIFKYRNSKYCLENFSSKVGDRI